MAIADIRLFSEGYLADVGRVKPLAATLRRQRTHRGYQSEVISQRLSVGLIPVVAKTGFGQ